MDSSNMQERGDGGQQRRGGFFRRGGGENRPSESPSRPSGPTEAQFNATQEEGREPQRSIESLEENLSFTQVARSSERIMPGGAKPEEVSSTLLIQPYREYTLILGINSGRMDFLDKQGRKIQGSEELHKAYTLRMNDLSGIGVQIEDSYIIFSGTGARISNSSFKAIQTKDEQGLELLPRNWKSASYIHEVEMYGFSKDLVGEIRNLQALEDSRFIKRVEDGYKIVVLDDELVILKPLQKIENAEYTDRLPKVGNNVTQDPGEKGVVYYCTSENPTAILKLDTKKASNTWQTEAAEIPKRYESIRNLRVDPTGNYFTFDSNGEFVVLASDSLQEVQKIPKFYGGILGDDGKVRGVDEQGYLVIYDANFQEVAQEADKRRIARIAQGLGADLFKKETTAASKVEVEQFQHLVPVKTDFETQFNEQLQTSATLEDISNIKEALGKLRTRLHGERLPPDQISFITQGIEDSIRGKEHVLALPIVALGQKDLETKLTGTLTIASLAEAKGDLAKLKSLEGLVDDATRAQIRTLESKFSQQSAELFKREGVVIEKDVGDLVTGVGAELEKMTSMPDFADWQEFRLPQLISRLGSLANDCPLEASETQKKILAARRQLQELSRDYETRFKEQYALVREKASQVLGERVELMKVDMDSFAERLRARGFKDRMQAETYVGSSEALGAIRTEIEELARQNPDAAKELDRALKIRIANIMSEIERGGLTSIAETGQQMELFGRTLFPKWEAPVKEKTQKKVDLIFMPNVRSEGPGVSADQIYGDVGLAVINSRGGIEKIRLYEGWDKEDRVRLGIKPLIPPAYVNHAEFDKIRKEYSDWNKGEKSEIRQNLSKKSQAIRELRNQRRGVGNKTPQEVETWRAEYDKALDDYLKFYAENHVSILHRVDRVKNAPESEYENGKGFVPDWQSHWTTDEQTERYLEDMAKALKMQLDLQEGLLDLKGHAGSGKDVLIKMFANRTNRPYFSTDCSKWTTEFELSEDVMLESKDGASQTVKVPSVVLNAITTPGAVMYFNEISAMPEQAQIFLHGLTDEKRTLTLKTSSGKAIKADKTVLLVSSRNPGYPGTFEPQFATKSRMVGLQVDYPPLLGEKDPNDRNQNAPYSASEALRIARSVDSLIDFTWEANPKHNDFVKIWDKNINVIENDAPDLTATQRFDLEVVLAMVQFANKLREGFILKFEKARASETRGKLLVDQPITGREMRRMAYFLSKMSAEEKATANPEVVTRSLIERFFLSHIDKKDEKEEIKTAMATWTSSKRPAA